MMSKKSRDTYVYIVNDLMSHRLRLFYNEQYYSIAHYEIVLISVFMRTENIPYESEK